MKYNLKFSIAILTVFAISLSGCLKNTATDMGFGFTPDNTSKVVEIAGAPAGAEAVNRSFNISLEFSSRDTTFSVAKVRLAAEQPAQEDVTITFVQNNALVTSYNTNSNSKYTVPAASIYTLPLTVTIPAGKREADLKVTTKPSVIAQGAYAFGLSIASVSNPAYKISGNFKDIVVTMGVKNKYDGVYSVVSGFVQRYTAPGVPTVNDALNGTLVGNPDVVLTTVGPNTVEITNIKWGAGSGSGVAGIDNLQATVDPVTNLVTMKALGNATLTNWEGKANKYDPATKTFYFAVIWNPTSNVRTYEIVLKYKGPR